MNKWTSLVVGAVMAGMMTSTAVRANEPAPGADPAVAPTTDAPAADAAPAPTKGKKKKKKGMACKAGKCNAKSGCKGDTKSGDAPAPAN